MQYRAVPYYPGLSITGSAPSLQVDKLGLRTIGFNKSRELRHQLRYRDHRHLAIPIRGSLRDYPIAWDYSNAS